MRNVSDTLFMFTFFIENHAIYDNMKNAAELDRP
jgi:hypothetical protein